MKIWRSNVLYFSMSVFDILHDDTRTNGYDSRPLFSFDKPRSRNLPAAIGDSFPDVHPRITVRALIYTCLLFNKNVIVVSEETRIVQ